MSAGKRGLPPHGRLLLVTLACALIAGVSSAAAGALGGDPGGARALWGALVPVLALLGAGGYAGLHLPAAISGDERFLERAEPAGAGEPPGGGDAPGADARLTLVQQHEEFLRRERSNRAARGKELLLGVPFAFAHAIVAGLVLLALRAITGAQGGEWGLVLTGPLLYLVAAVPFLVVSVAYRRIVEKYFV